MDRVLRKHGQNIIGKQFATRRLADAMIDLFVLACTLSRVSTEVQSRGATAVTTELEIPASSIYAAITREKNKQETTTQNTT